MPPAPLKSNQSGRSAAGIDRADFMDIVILTEARYESAAPSDPYLTNLLQEDELLAAALRRQGCSVRRIDWARPDADWSQPCAAIFRSTWDYFLKIDAFLDWLAGVELQLPLFNTATTVRWNANKLYLRDLQQRGIRIVETEFCTRAELPDLNELLQRWNGERVILKPAVSGAAWHTYLLDRNSEADISSALRDFAPDALFLVQPFQTGITQAGEISLIVIDGQVTHAVRKQARAGDFRVQDDHGGTVAPHVPTGEEIDFALQAIAACDPPPLYARVDLIRDNAGELALMELELIEPELFFRFHPQAADRLAKAAVRSIISDRRP